MNTPPVAGSAPDPLDTLFFDGQCPLCTREMDALQQARGDGLALVDIHSLDPQALADLPARDTLLKTLHLRRGSGEWLRGADANVAAWEGTGQQRWLRMLRWPILRHIVDLAYACWASLRYRRLYGRPGTDPDHTDRHASDN